MIKVGEKFFKKYVWFALGVFTVITIFLAIQIPNIRFDYDFEKFFPQHDEETSYFFEHRQRFSSDNDFVLLAIENNKGIFDKSFLKKVDKLSRVLDSFPYVENVMSITNQKEVFIFSNGSTSTKDYIDFNDYDPVRDSIRIYENKELINAVVADDAKSVCIFIKHEDYLAKKKSDKLLLSIESLVEKFGFDNVRIGGRIRGQKYYIDKMTEEMALYVGLGVLLVLVFLVIAFRSIWGLLLPQVVILGALVWLVGGMSLIDQPINIILTTIPTIMFVVSMSDVIHLISRYLDSLRDGREKFEAIKEAVSEVGLATLLTSITTAIGFYSLYFVRVEPIQRFGLVIGTGVLMAFVLTFALLPALFYLTEGPRYVSVKSQDHFWKKYLHKWFRWLLNHYYRVLVITGVVVAVCFVGLSRMKVDNLIMDDLDPSEQIQKDFRFLGKHYGGIRPFELAAKVKDTSLNAWDPEILQQLDSVEQYLENTYGVNVRVSLTKSLKVLNRASHVGDTSYYKLPESRKKLRKLRRPIKIANQGKFYYTLVDSTERIIRISGSMEDYGNQAVRAKNDSLFNYISKHKLDRSLDYTLTGTAHLLDKNMRYLSSSLILGLSVSILIVALIIGSIYRSLTIMVISIITNVIPLIFLAGVMGFWGVNLKTSTAIIFTIGFGIAVDDTIHYLGKFKYELLKGKSKIYALKRSYLTTGKAMILTTLILCAGFLLLVLSSFQGSFYMGVMLCITLMVALIADITILPVLLLLFYKPRKRKN